MIDSNEASERIKVSLSSEEEEEEDGSVNEIKGELARLKFLNVVLLMIKLPRETMKEEE